MDAIQIRGVGKRYRIGKTPSTTLREALPELLHLGRREPVEEIWALRDLDLTVAEGEVLGIAGSNGAGKSTLLRVLARITEPTTGSSRTRGRVGALLDVGTGFHGELTGRENVYVNGALLGLSRRAIRERLDAIVAFAEVERFLDTPLKRYSSGMQLRLAFAIAAEIQPEIVVVDEVLAVGDAEFQRRCLDRMSEMQQAGRTVIFVSHDAGTMAQLCSRVVWLDQGRIVADGPTREVLSAYLSAGEGKLGADFEPRPDLDLSPVRVSVSGADGPPRRGEKLVVEVTLAARTEIRKHDLAIILTTPDGVRVIDEALTDSGLGPIEMGAGKREVIRLELPPILAPDRYGLHLWLGTAYETHFEENLLTFDLLPKIDDSAESIQRRRIAQPEVTWLHRGEASA
jgi:ABC-type polysaccharide/polyol phosphate transport system ATPase subunit